MVVIWGGELNGGPIRMGVFRQLSNLRLCEDGNVYAAKRRHLVLHQRLSTVFHQPVGWSVVVFQTYLFSITHTS